MPRRAIVLLLLGLAACGFAREQLDVASVNGCIKKTCTDPEAQAYQQCEAACRTRYGQ